MPLLTSQSIIFSKSYEAEVWNLKMEESLQSTSLSIMLHWLRSKSKLLRKDRVKFRAQEADGQVCHNQREAK